MSIFAPILFTATFAVSALWTFVLIAVFQALALICILLVLSRGSEQTGREPKF